MIGLWWSAAESLKNRRQLNNVGQSTESQRVNESYPAKTEMP